MENTQIADDRSPSRRRFSWKWAFCACLLALASVSALLIDATADGAISNPRLADSVLGVSNAKDVVLLGGESTTMSIDLNGMVVTYNVRNQHAAPSAPHFVQNITRSVLDWADSWSKEVMLFLSIFGVFGIVASLGVGICQVVNGVRSLTPRRLA